jgi:hypothetical protein
MRYRGSCHCGKITIEVEGELAQAMQCNCSICSKKGYLLWFVPRANMRWLTPDNELATYTFNKHQIQHHFCPTCGCSPFSEAIGPTGEAMAAINVRCLDNDIDLAALKIIPYDGRSK